MKLKKRILGLLLALSILIVPTTQVFAAFTTPPYRYEFLGNIKNITYIVTSSANSSYINQINLAISNWRSSSHLNNKPVFNKTTSSLYSIKFDAKSVTSDLNVLGETRFYTLTGGEKILILTTGTLQTLF